ncbi:phosphatase PAP2 family protein [Treponema pedis]|uniref:phosphatase PAP2 family protein n=1 Tax=Treponema pedis TaxID=409322 RepID=UPI0003FCED6D|nr:phosphatase PAP2 family protein [Treponema pedis]
MNELTNAVPQAIPAIYLWGIEFIKAVQTVANPALTEVVKIFTDVSVYGFGILIPLIYMWCIDYKKGLHLLYVLTFGTGLTDGIKLILHVPRPYTYAPEVMLTTETSFSTPSGHSFTGALMYPAVLFYGAKTKLKNKLKLFLAIIFPFAIGVSRIYLGVHYPTDVLSGWFLGGFVFFIFFLFTEKIENKISGFAEALSKVSSKNIKSVKFAAAAGFSFFLILICNEKVYGAGALFGLAFGNIYIFEPLKINFNASSGTPVQKIFRFILGFAVSIIPVLAVYFAKINASHSQFRLYVFLEFAAVGAIVSGLMPLIFVKLNLCRGKNAGR